MTKKNPFPGMNPFFEQRWTDAHTMLIGYIRDALQEKLPDDLLAGAEEESIAIGADSDSLKFRPDVSVKQPWESSGGGLAVAPPIHAPQAAQPIGFLIEDELERWVEIHDSTGRLVTVLEILSPSNKDFLEARERFQGKRRMLLSGGVNVVEIDLIRQGASVFQPEIAEWMRKRDAWYGICVFRAAERGKSYLYPIRLREPLPVISVPLRPGEAEIALELQPLIDRCHERGRYHMLNYRAPLNPPPNESDAKWIEGLLRQHQLIS